MSKPALEKSEIINLIGEKRYQAWVALCNQIESLYEMETLWNHGGKKWLHEYKYRRGGKTLCALYLNQDSFGFMIIFGKEERLKVEDLHESLSEKSYQVYQESTTYHDGKWVMFDIQDTSLLPDFEKLLKIKRKPNKK